MNFNMTLSSDSGLVLAVVIHIPIPKIRIIGDLRYDFDTSVVIGTHIWKLIRVSQRIK